MSKKTKIYLKFLVCFCVCMALYIMSTYLKTYTQRIFIGGEKYWIIEFILIIVISLLNGIVFDDLNKKLLEQPENIYEMISYLLLQLYSFAIILIYIMLVVSKIGISNRYFSVEIFEINIMVFLLYVVYILASKKRKDEKYTVADAVKIIIVASIIFQSSLTEILFLAIYILLLTLLTKSKILYTHNLRFLLYGISFMIIIVEISIAVSSQLLLNKIVFSITNIFMWYIGIKDYCYLKKI